MLRALSDNAGMDLMSFNPMATKDLNQNEDATGKAGKDSDAYFTGAQGPTDTDIAAAAAVVPPVEMVSLERDQSNVNIGINEDANLPVIFNSAAAAEHQTTLVFGSRTGQPMISRNAPTWTTNQRGSGADKPKKRCAVCVWNYCPRRRDCDGNGGRASCGCNHSRVPPTGRIRTSDKEIQEFEIAHPGLGQSEREAKLVELKGM